MTLSWCWDMPLVSPVPEPPAPEDPLGPLPVAHQLIHVLFDRLRDFPDAYRAMQEALRQWRAIHLPRRS